MARFIDILRRERAISQPEAVIIGDEQLAITDEESPYVKSGDVLNLAPPFNDFFIEGKNQDGYWYGVRYRVVKNPFESEPVGTKWTLGAWCYFGANRKFGCTDRPALYYVGADGRCLNPLTRKNPGSRDAMGIIYPPIPLLLEREQSRFRNVLNFKEMTHMLYFSDRVLTLLNCINVELEAHEPPEALAKNHQKKYRIPMSSWYELRLKTKRYAKAEESERDESGDRVKMREHLVRGHFKRRASGVFWWSSFVRGEHELGTIVKSYKLPVEG